MNNFGFIRVVAAMPVVHVADPEANVREIVLMLQDMSKDKPSVAVFPELCITGFTCSDLFGSQALIDKAENAVRNLLEQTACLDMTIVFGTPIRHQGRLYNCAVVAREGQIVGIVPKTYLAGSGEFYEPRWFESAARLDPAVSIVEYASQEASFGVRQLFSVGKAMMAVELCQDLWSPVPPCSYAAVKGANLIVNLSASNEYLFKHEYRKSLVSSTSSRLFAAYVYCSCGYGESTQDMVWAGSSLIYENGGLMAESERFQTGNHYICADVDIEKLDTLRTKEHSFACEGAGADYMLKKAGDAAGTDFQSHLLRKVEPHPFVPKGNPAELDMRCREILSTQVMGLMTRLDHIHCRKAVIGISGGLDSTLALLVTVLAFDRLGIERSNIIGITMPGFGTTGRTHGNSVDLMDRLGITSMEIPIVEATRCHFSDIGQDENNHDLTYENSQARERTQILMDMAGKTGGIVIGTGDLSELALGWCTYNGDHMSMYAVNVSVPKTLVKTLVIWAAENKFNTSESIRSTLLDIADTPISPELLPAAKDGNICQKTEDVVGPYELHDFYLYNFFRFGFAPEKILLLATKAFEGEYDHDTIKKWLSNFMKRFFRQQFKRSCIPDGPKVGSVSLSPRGDWRMPSDLETYWDLPQQKAD